MGISRQAYYKRKRAYDVRVQHDQSVLDFVLEKRRRQPRLGRASCTICCKAKLEPRCKWGEIVCSPSCEMPVNWCRANMRITKPRTAIIGSDGIPTY